MEHNKITGMAERCTTLNSLLEANEEDFSLEYTAVNKNNITREGYCICSKSSNCSPIVYYQKDWYEKSDSEVINYLREIFHKHSCNFNESEILNKQYLLNNVLPSLVSNSNLSHIKASHIAHIPFLDLLILFYVPLNVFRDTNTTASLTVTTEILDKADISYEELYETALANIESKTTVKSMFESLCELVPDKNPAYFEDAYHNPMIICGTQRQERGAASILCSSVRKKLHKYLGPRVAVLPSSIHECIAVPYESEEELKFFQRTVCEINHTQVAPEDVLCDSVYYIENSSLKLFS